MNRLKHAAAILDAIEEVRQLPGAAGARACTVCLRTPSGEVVGHFRMPSYAHVRVLERRLGLLGYEMSILHSASSGCDFAFSEAAAARHP